MRALVIVLAAAALGACQDRDKPVAGVCKPFGEAQAAAPGPGAAALDDCLHRWAYTLARGRDEPGAVAAAVVTACSAHLSRWNQQALGAEDPAGDAPSLVTGRTTNPIAERANFASDRALFYVVQARAGDCRPPPRREGAPPMTMPEK